METYKKKLVFLTGAGISEESGLATFRGTNGLWGDYDPMVVCSLKGWQTNPKLVQQFYNERRVQLENVFPNESHFLCEKFREYYDVSIITTNVDDLHERAGSINVLHLHGELTKVCDETKETVEDIGYGLLSELEFSRRPFVVFFGESVPKLEAAADLIAEADVLVLIGTSLSVYPANGLISCLPANDNRVFVYIDPNASKNLSLFVDENWGDLEELKSSYDITIMDKKSTEGLRDLLTQVERKFS
jgi:NAD-dependent deacetylase